MIIFDTNAVHLLSPDGYQANIIRRLRQSGRHRVAVPWMVMEEMIAHRAKRYYDDYQAARGKHRALRQTTPWDIDDLEPLDLERCQKHWKRQYGQIFEVVKTSGSAARRALSREAMGLKPAKQVTDAKGNERSPQGARDVAIWFSILEFMRKNPDEVVYFVTNNTTDFGDGVTHPYPMDEDIRGMEKRLILLKDFNAVLSQFTKDVPGEKARAAADELLSSESVRTVVAQAAWKMLNSDSGYQGIADDAQVQWVRWLGAPEAQLLSVSEVTGHELEGTTWYTVKAGWLLYGEALEKAPGFSPVRVACRWDLTVLFSPNDGDKPPALLDRLTPKRPDMNAPNTEEAMQEVRERIRQRNRVARRRGTDVADLNASLTQFAGIDLRSVMGVVAGVQPPIGEVLASMSEQIAASVPTPDYSGLFSTLRLLDTSAFEQIAASVPTPDYSGLFSTLRLPPSVFEQFTSSLPALDVASALHDQGAPLDMQLETSETDAMGDTENEAAEPGQGEPDGPNEDPGSR